MTFRTLGLIGGTMALVMTTAQAWADTNPTPIAVPLLNVNATSPNPGSPYPSTITVTPPEGTATLPIYIDVWLHAVTHPCPEDLAVLLVRNDTEKYLLMSNAGGCRALQGTDIRFAFGAPALPDEESSTAPHGASLTIAASNYGAPPVFPSPAPAGPYTPAEPRYPTSSASGTWRLYVIDVHAANRGVIAGGWSLTYYPYFDQRSQQTSIDIPAVGPAGAYPITFDLSHVASNVRVRNVYPTIGFSHTYADDLRVVLQSPAGTAVVLMANAGGRHPVGQLEFRPEGRVIPDEEAILPRTPYRPGSVYGTPIGSLPAPAPPEPYATSFTAFRGQPARGVWKLWVYDDEWPDFGTISGAVLGIEPDAGSALLTLLDPTAMPTYTANQPFLRLGGQVESVYSQVSAIWRNVVNGTFYDAGTMTVSPVGASAAVVLGDIPLKAGTNVVSVRVMSATGYSSTNTLTVTVNEFTYTLSEGATGGFFNEDLTIANPTGAAAPVVVELLRETDPPIAHPDSVPAHAPLQLRVDDLAPPGAMSAVVRSTNAVPLAVERTMSWDDAGYGGHGGTAITPDTRWFFAEGSQGYFDTYLLLANDSATDVSATVRFLLEGGGVVNHAVTIGGHTRLTIYAGDIPALANRSFGIDVTASSPITAERSMYFPHGSARLFEGGHEAGGVNATSRKWFLAEGATGPFFECFVLLSNPNATPAHATLTYLLPSGETINEDVTIAANGRLTRNVETVDARLANTPVSTIVTSDIGIIVERSMYWPDITSGWREAHNSFGTTNAAFRWGVSDGRIGGTRAHQTYILLANPNPAPAEVQVAFLKGGIRGPVLTYTLPATSRHNIWVNGDAPSLGDGVFSADIQVLNFQPIVVEKAMYWDVGPEIWGAGTGVVATRLPPP